MPINPAMYSSIKDEWSTPQEFFDRLDKQFEFTLDAAGTFENAKVKSYFDIGQNGLACSWHGFTVFVNPPFSLVGEFVQKACEESKKHRITVVMLIAARTDTKYFHQFVMRAKEIRFVKGRLKFGGSTNSAPFPSMVVVWSPGKHKVPKISTMENKLV